MQKTLKFFLFCCLSFVVMNVFGQDLKTNINANKKEQDSLRKTLDQEKDSLVFTSRFVRYTTLKLTKDSIQTLPIDTTLFGIQNFSVLSQPRKPTVGTGVMGLAAMPLLFEPVKTIGFDAGFHALDFYMLKNEDVRFYRARSPFSSLHYVNGGEKEQVLKLIHTQNIKKNWNFGATYDRIGANGFYTYQRGDDLNGSVFTWYESPNKRYNLWFNGVFNTLKAQENGSIVNDSIFGKNNVQLIDKMAETVRLRTAKQLWRKTGYMLKQSYFVGRIDTTSLNNSQNILPTNKISHTLTYSKSQYSFKKDEEDIYEVFPSKPLADPIIPIDAIFTNDSTNVKHLQNEFIYSFFLRAKGNSIIKNELKIDAGFRHDFYQYAQYGILRDKTFFYQHNTAFQNIALLGSLGYRFSNRIDLNVDLQQIFQGRHTGDYLYEVKSNVLLSKSTGRIVLGAYVQNKSPEEIYSRYFGNYYNWNNTLNFERTKTANLSFSYVNDPLNFEATANYYLITDYLYFMQNGTANDVIPVQQGGDISMLKITVAKGFSFKSWHLDAYAVYQKTDNSRVIRTPEVYAFASMYKDWTLFKTLKTQVGVDLKYNTPFVNAGYAPAISQFYNTTSAETLGSKPIADVWIKAGLKRANLFVKYDYVNQGLFNKGYYTVNRYPMPDRLLKFGFTWNFYD